MRSVPRPVKPWKVDWPLPLLLRRLTEPEVALPPQPQCVRAVENAAVLILPGTVAGPSKRDAAGKLRRQLLQLRCQPLLRADQVRRVPAEQARHGLPPVRPCM